MNMRQAKRIALATEASFILNGAPTDAITDLLSEENGARFQAAQKDMAWAMLRRAGFDSPMEPRAILMAVLGQKLDGKIHASDKLSR